MLRVLINRYNPKTGNALLKFLPKEQLMAISSIDIQSNDLKPILSHPKNSLAKIHYSWIKPLLDKYPDRLQSTIKIALTDEQMGGIKGTASDKISSPIKNFILNELCSQLNINQHIPIEFLPDSEFSPIVGWTKKQIVDLVDFLGLYDLASEVRIIVNRDHLKNIYSCLTPKQLQYLKIILHQKELLTSPKLGIDLGSLESKQLLQVLHRRGLSRLGKALCGQHKDLVWVIAHTLDMARGSILLKLYQPAPIPKVTSILKQEVLNIIKFLYSE